MSTDVSIQRALEERLLDRQLLSGGWSFRRSSSQAACEPTCLALMALRLRPSDVLERSLHFLLETQDPNGSWPAFNGDDHDGCWVTALAVMTLINCGRVTHAIERGLRWLLTSRGRESHWLWRWKFRTSDTHVDFNPDKFGWCWMPGTCSWVVPTAFAVLALKQGFLCCQSQEVRFRITRGVEMLLDRACANGGWNAGNSVVYSVPLAPHIDATATALLALRGEKQTDTIAKSLDWLERRAQSCAASWSLAWSILALDAHGRNTEALLAKLAALTYADQVEDSATLAVVILAFDCPIQGNVFRVTV